MCGITGAIWTDPQRGIDDALLAKMTGLLAHRGPDDSGTLRSDYRLRPPYEAMPGVALGHRRLSIIDIEGGHQPMSNEDGSVWVVFNGEIYNFPDLRRRLEGSGHTFKTRSDTEVLVHLYEDEGPEMFDHLVGMFALAIWDAPRQRLLLGRDRLGQKPLFYRQDEGRLLFASELKSILAVPDVPREIDAGSLDEYLTYQYVPHPNTIFSGIRKLPPGHFAIYQHQRLDVRRYWRPDFALERRRPCGDESQQLRELLEASVCCRMLSDVPLGAFLSGGVDSSLIVALMQRYSEQPIKTFSIGFPDRGYDESPHARMVAEHLGTEHHEFQVTPDAVEILPKLVWHFDEPFADSSAIPTWYVSQLTRQHVKVALTGDGGDELFAGYRRYLGMKIGSALDWVPPLRAMLSSRVWQWLPAPSGQSSLLRRARRFSEVLRHAPERRYLEMVSIFNEQRRVELYQDDFLAALPDSDPFGFLMRAWQQSKGRDAVSSAAAADLITYLPCDLMTKVDIASMAHGLECRQPFLDHRLVEFALSLPSGRKLGWRRGKRILRQTFGDLIPRQVWQRPKQGFGVPLPRWFREDLREMTSDVLLSEASLARNIFNADAVRQLINEHQQGHFNHSARLWALLVLELWQQQWIDQRAE